MAANKSALGLNRSLSSSFLVAEKYKPCDVYGEACLVIKMLTNGLTINLSQRARVEKTFYGVETH